LVQVFVDLCYSKEMKKHFVVYLLIFVLGGLSVFAFLEIIQTSQLSKETTDLISVGNQDLVGVSQRGLISQFDDIVVPLDYGIASLGVSRLGDDVFFVSYFTGHGFGASDTYHVNLQDRSVKRPDSLILEKAKDVFKGVRTYSVAYDKDIWNERNEYVPVRSEVLKVASELSLKESDLNIELVGDKPNFIITVGTEYNPVTGETVLDKKEQVFFPDELPSFYTHLDVFDGVRGSSDRSANIIFDYDQDNKTITISSE